MILVRPHACHQPRTFHQPGPVHPPRPFHQSRPFSQRGVSLVEVVVFIVVVGILAAGLFSALSNSLRGTPQAGQTDSATEMAQQRMELILAQRRAVGFAFVDPCPAAGAAICNGPLGYSASSTIATNWNGDTNYRVITVTVTGPSTVPSTATATALVANY